jgi:hypothetical protein
MSVLDDEAIDVVRAAYRPAWAPFNALFKLTPDEKLHGPQKLRDYIEVLVSAGNVTLKGSHALPSASCVSTSKSTAPVPG